MNIVLVILFCLGLWLLLSAVAEELSPAQFILAAVAGLVFIAPLMIKVYRIVL